MCLACCLLPSLLARQREQPSLGELALGCPQWGGIGVQIAWGSQDSLEWLERRGHGEPPVVQPGEDPSLGSLAQHQSFLLKGDLTSQEVYLSFLF